MEIKKSYISSTDAQTCELVHWDTVKADCKYPESDNNNGYVYGIYLLDDIDIIDVCWYKTEEERNREIERNNLRVINDY